MTGIIVLLVVVAALVVYGIAAYNGLVALRRRYTLKHTTFPLEKTSCGSSCQVRSSCYFFELSNAAHSAG